MRSGSEITLLLNDLVELQLNFNFQESEDKVNSWRTIHMNIIFIHKNKTKYIIIQYMLKVKKFFSNSELKVKTYEIFRPFVRPD